MSSLQLRASMLMVHIPRPECSQGSRVVDDKESQVSSLQCVQGLKAGVTVMCGSWKMCALKHTALVKFITWTTITWTRSFVLWYSSDIYFCPQSVCLHSNRSRNRSVKATSCFITYLKDSRDQYQQISTMLWERSTEVATLACMHRLCYGREAPDRYPTNVYMNLQEDGSTFNPLVSQSSDLRRRGGTNDLFGVWFDCRRTYCLNKSFI